jgi:hypothetical protein
LTALKGNGVSVTGRFDAVRDRRLWQCGRDSPPAGEAPDTTSPAPHPAAAPRSPPQPSTREWFHQLDGDALIYRIDYRDAAATLDFVVTHYLTGPWNAVPDSTAPPTSREFFARLTAEAGYPDLTCRGEIATPTVPITSARLRAAGFTFHPVIHPGFGRRVGCGPCCRVGSGRCAAASVPAAVLPLRSGRPVSCRS